MSRGSDFEDQIGLALSKAAGWVIAIAILVALWLIFKSVELVVRVMVAQPRNSWLWGMLITFLISLALAIMTGGQSALI